MPPAIISECNAEVAEQVDALVSKTSGAKPRAGSSPAFGTSHSSEVRSWELEVRITTMLNDEQLVEES